MTKHQGCLSALAFVGALVAMGSAAHAQNDVCIPVAPTPPVIDGVIDGDPGWAGSSRIDLDVSGVAPLTYLRLCRVDGPEPKIYVALRVESYDVAPTSFDRIVIALQPITEDDMQAPLHAWRIHIDPFSEASDTGTYSPGGVQFWMDSSSWPGSTTGTNPDEMLEQHWLQKSNMKIMYEGDGKWGFEMVLNVNRNAGTADQNVGVYVPPQDRMRFYFNLVKLEGYGFACQYAWPRDLSISPTLTGGTPLPDSWGTASLSTIPNCTVELRYDQIGMYVPPSPHNYKLALYSPMSHSGPCESIVDAEHQGQMGPPNMLYATPINRMPMDATFSTRFYVANWGVPAPGDWFLPSYPSTVSPPLAQLPNPAATATLIPGQMTTMTLQWPLTFKQSCQYGSVPEKSIKVELIGQPDVKFAANPVVRSVASGTASRFTHDARIGTAGYPAPPSGAERMILTVAQDSRPRIASTPSLPIQLGPSIRGPQRALRSIRDSDIYVRPEKFADPDFGNDVSQTLTWTCRAYRRTGQTLMINDRPQKMSVETLRPAGGFGYVVGHAGDVESWRATFTGQGLRKRDEGFFEMDIPSGQAGLVNTLIEAQEFRRWAFGLRFGFAVPHGDFADAFDGGACETVTAEYRLTPMFSLEGRVGYAAFEGESGLDDAGLFSNSINGKATFLKGDFRPFVNAGVGFYVAEPGNDDFGVNVGGGVRWRLSDLVGIEASYDFHNVFADRDDPRFSTLQAGISLRF